MYDCEVMRTKQIIYKLITKNAQKVTSLYYNYKFIYFNIFYIAYNKLFILRSISIYNQYISIYVVDSQHLHHYHQVH